MGHQSAIERTSGRLCRTVLEGRRDSRGGKKNGEALGTASPRSRFLSGCCVFAIYGVGIENKDAPQKPPERSMGRRTAGLVAILWLEGSG